MAIPATTDPLALEAAAILGNAELKCCSPAARCAWYECLFHMYATSTDRVSGTMSKLGKMWGCHAKEARQIVTELRGSGDCEVVIEEDETNPVTLVSRRHRKIVNRRNATALRVLKHRVEKEGAARNAGRNAASNAIKKVPGEEQVTWLTPYGDLWRLKTGGVLHYGRAARELRPLHLEFGGDDVLHALSVYLDNTELEYVSITRFVETYGKWAGTHGTFKTGHVPDNRRHPQTGRVLPEGKTRQELGLE